MPKPYLPPVYSTGPLHLNAYGTTITYKKSHQGPNAVNWDQGEYEEMERLFTSGTLRTSTLYAMHKWNILEPSSSGLEQLSEETGSITHTPPPPLRDS
jgi:hypothetical protein